MNIIDILIRRIVTQVNQDWFTEAIKKVIEENNRKLK